MGSNVFNSSLISSVFREFLWGGGARGSVVYKNKFHGSRETRLEAEFSASAVGTPPPSRIKGADAAPKRWEVSRSDPPPSGQRPKSH